MHKNWYKSREEIKEEKRRNRRIVRNIIFGYLIFASIVLILSYCKNNG